MSLAVKIWLCFGIVLMLAELVIPGAILVFLGMGALLVAGCLYFGLITSTVHSIILWFILSILLVGFLRSLFMKLMPGDVVIENTDEDLDAIGSVVEVSEKIYPHKEGRIKFRGTSWIAISDEEIAMGEKAIIKGRDGNKWVVGFPN